MMKNIAVMALIASASALQFPIRELAMQAEPCCRCPVPANIITARPETSEVLVQIENSYRQNTMTECCTCDPTNGYNHGAFNTYVPYDARGEGQTSEELNNGIKSIGARNPPFVVGGPN